jgi:hypothetical protein
VAAADGYIYTADARSGSIRVYDPSGRFVRRFGRRGDGPGEFSPAIYIVGAVDDSVQVYDENRGTIMVFRRDGTFLRTQRIARIPKDRVLAGYLSGGRALVRIEYFPERRGAWMDSVAFTVTDSTAHEIVRVAAHPADPPAPMLRVGSIVFEGGQEFTAQILSAQHPAGNRAIAVLPAARSGGNPGQVTIVFLGFEGIRSEHVVDLGARRITETVVDAWSNRLLDPLAERLTAAGTPRDAAEKTLREGTILPEYLPDVVEAHYGSDEVVWLKPYDSREWFVVSPAGEILFRVQVPDGVRLFQVSATNAWAVVTDALGLPVVTRFRLVASVGSR